MGNTGRSPVGWAELADAVPGGVAVQSEGVFVYVSEAFASMVGVTPEALRGERWETLFGDREAARFERHVLAGLRPDGQWEGTVRVGGQGGEERPLAVRLSRADDRSVVWVASDGSRPVTEREQTGRTHDERDPMRRQGAPATLDRIGDLLLETVRALVQTTSRDAIERTITRRLTDSDLYAFAWVGEPELDGDRIVPRTRSGAEQGYLADIALPEADGIPGNGPAGRAVRTGDVQVANVDDPVFEPWRDRAAARGFESLLAVPLQHGGRSTGC